MTEREARAHDPKCLAYGYGPGQRMDICICLGIGIGRADERARVWAEVEPLITVVAQNGNAKPVLPYWRVRKVITGKEQLDE